MTSEDNRIAIVAMGFLLLALLGIYFIFNKNVEEYNKNEVKTEKQSLNPDSLVCIHDMADRIILVEDFEEPHRLKDYIYIPIQAINFFKVGDTITGYNHFICNECPESRFYIIKSIPSYTTIGGVSKFLDYD